ISVARAKAGSVCHSVSSDAVPSTSPCQPTTCAFAAVARTPAIINGRPATAAKIRRARRRVMCVSLRIAHRHFHGSRAAELDRLHQRRAALLVEILDLAI